MSDGPNDIMVVLILAGIVLFVLAAGFADLAGGFRRIVSTRRRRRREREMRQAIMVDPIDGSEIENPARPTFDESEQI